jgi:hypothetical protein
LPDSLSITVQNDDLQAIFVVQMYVHGRRDQPYMAVLYLSQVISQPSLVVLVNKRDDAYPFALDLIHPLIIYNIVPNGIS